MRNNVQFRIEAAKKRNDELRLRCCYAGSCGYSECGMLPLSRYKLELLYNILLLSLIIFAICESIKKCKI